MISDLSEALHSIQKQTDGKVLNYFAILKEGHQPLAEGYAFVSLFDDSARRFRLVEQPRKDDLSRSSPSNTRWGQALCAVRPPLDLAPVNER